LEPIFRVLPRQVDQTLAAALRQWMPGASWNAVRKLLKARRVMLSGNVCVDPARRLKLHDVVKVLAHPAAPPPREEDVRIRYLDEHVVVVEKPAAAPLPQAGDPFPAWVSFAAVAGLIALVPLALVYGQSVAPWILPGLMGGFLLFGFVRGVRIYEAFVEGAQEGFQVALRIITHEAANSPFREAIQVIEDDPDTVLDVLDLLQRDALPRNQARQPIVRGGLDRLQLSGAVVLDSGVYRFKNELYRTVLSKHFSAAHVGHLLRMSGRWQEAIGYLSVELAQKPHERASLLEAIVQSIYASDDLESAYSILLQGIQHGFGLSHVGIYRAWEGRGKLMLVQSDIAEAMPREIDLSDLDCVEVQTFRSSDYALRGAPDDRRLVARLVPERRPIGLVTINHYFSVIAAHDAVYHRQAES
jgi:hypothetical protein